MEAFLTLIRYNELEIKRLLLHMCQLSDIQALRNMWKVFQSSFLIVCVSM